MSASEAARRWLGLGWELPSPGAGPVAPTARLWAGLVARTVAGAALYGAVLGAWRGGAQTAYAALKLPLVLLATTALTIAFQWVAARMLGSGLRFWEVALFTARAQATAAVLLAALVPVVALFTLAAPPPSPAARTAHNLLYLLHTGVVGGCGLAGTVTLWRQLGRRLPPAALVRRLYAAWILVFALVGGEVAWALRPFVGSVYLPVTFLRRQALDGNVYEFIVTDVVPHLTSGGRAE